MKKLILSGMALVAIATITITGCKKDDSGSSPVITLTGDASITASLNASYVDDGATATDAEDGTLIVTSDESSSNPDVNNTGTYTITYSATDADGNTSTAKRTVIIRNDAYEVEGAFTTTEDADVWSQTITLSSTENNVITFSKFANFQNNTGIKARVTTVGADRYVIVNPSPQSAAGIGTNGCNHEFGSDGNGTKLSQVAGKWTFSIKFTDKVTGGGGGCTATSAQPFEDVFVQN